MNQAAEIGPWGFIIVTLCAIRLTQFTVYDSLIGANLASRSKFSVWLDRFGYDADGNDRSFIRGKIADLLHCVFCIGFWWTCLSLVGWAYGPEWLRWVEIAWAAAAIQCTANFGLHLLVKYGEELDRRQQPQQQR